MPATITHHQQRGRRRIAIAWGQFFALLAVLSALVGLLGILFWRDIAEKLAN